MLAGVIHRWVVEGHLSKAIVRILAFPLTKGGASRESLEKGSSG